MSDFVQRSAANSGSSAENVRSLPPGAVRLRKSSGKNRFFMFFRKKRLSYMLPAGKVKAHNWLFCPPGNCRIQQ